MVHYLTHHVREQGTVSLEEGVRKMTSLPAGRFGLRDRGLVSRGLPGRPGGAGFPGPGRRLDDGPAPGLLPGGGARPGQRGAGGGAGGAHRGPPGTGPDTFLKGTAPRRTVPWVPGVESGWPSLAGAVFSPPPPPRARPPPPPPFPCFLPPPPSSALAEGDLTKMVDYVTHTKRRPWTPIPRRHEGERQGSLDRQRRRGARVLRRRVQNVPLAGRRPAGDRVRNTVVSR